MTLTSYLRVSSNTNKDMKVYEHKIVEVVEIKSFLVEDKISLSALSVIAAINGVSDDDVFVAMGENEQGGRRVQVTINKIIEVSEA